MRWPLQRGLSILLARREAAQVVALLVLARPQLSSSNPRRSWKAGLSGRDYPRGTWAMSAVTMHPATLTALYQCSAVPVARMTY